MDPGQTPHPQHCLAVGAMPQQRAAETNTGTAMAVEPAPVAWLDGVVESAQDVVFLSYSMAAVAGAPSTEV